MALFKVLRGSSEEFITDLTRADVTPPFNDGFCYFLKDTHMFYIDYAIKDANGNIIEKHRVPLNANDAKTLDNALLIRDELSDGDDEILSAKLVHTEIARIDNLISTTIGDAIAALQNDKMDKVNPTGSGQVSINGTATGTNAVSFGGTASGAVSVSFGNSTASGNFAFAHGVRAEATGTSSTAIGRSATAEGQDATALGSNVTAFGKSSLAVNNFNIAEGESSQAMGDHTHALGLASHSEGCNTTATHKAQHVEGEWNELDSSSNTAENRGTYVHITGIGTGKNDRKNGFTVDWNGNIWGARSLAHGNNVTSSGENSYAGGNAVIASGVSSHAEGSNNEAKGSASHTEGNSTYASGSYSHAEGNRSQATSQAAHAEGRATKASGYYSHAEGDKTQSTNDASHAEGSYTVASGRFSHAEGEKSAAFGTSSHAEGTGAKTTTLTTAAAQGATSIIVESIPASTVGLQYIVVDNEVAEIQSISGTTVTLKSGLTKAHSVGKAVLFSGAFATSSHVEGNSNTATGLNAHAEGLTTIASGQQAHSEGYRALASGNNSHAEGYMTQATGNNAHAEGNYTFSIGENAHTEGEGSQADSASGHAEGIRTYVSAEAINGGHAEGGETQVYAEFGHAEGYLTNVAHGATYAHAEGANTVAGNVAAHAEGDQTTAEGTASHSEGSGTVAEGDYSHSEGQNSKASGISSHAEGANTIASGKQAHAEGLKTLASGDRSHAQGYSTIASGTHSFSSGRYIMAKGFNSFATGSGNYKTLGFTGDANSKTYTISTSVFMNSTEHLQGIEFFAGAGYQQYQTPPAPIYQTQPSGGEMLRSSQNITNTAIYVLDPGYVYTAFGSDTESCLFDGAHPLKGGTYVTAYNLQNGVVIDRTSATKPAYLTVRESEIMWETHLGYCNPIFDGSGNIMYWDASYEWHQARQDSFSQEVSRTENTTEKLPSGSYVVGSNGLIKISSQSGSTVVLEKTLSATALSNSSYDIVLADKGAFGDCSFVAGNKNSASNNYAVSLGSSNTSSGLAAFTAGEYNTASATGSFAIGSHTTASGQQSLATGYYTTASGNQQVVFGKYNVSDTTSALIIGNGTSTSNKKNAFTVSKTGIVYAQNRLNIAGLDLEQDAAKYTLFVNGPAFFSGTVKAAEPIKANDLTTKNYVDNNLPRMTHSWITATAGQSVFNFTTPDTGCPAVTDLANYYYVYFNGLLLIPGLHYTVSGATVTFVGWAAEAGDVCHVTGFKPISPAT